MAVIVKKLKGKQVQKHTYHNDWEPILLLIKIILILFIIFSSFHWLVKKRVHQLPTKTWASSNTNLQHKNAISTYRVQAGDTLWKIAAKHYPGSNPMDKINEIKRVNGMVKDQIQLGQLIKLP